MPPQQNYPVTPPSNYDFILNHNPSPKRSLIPGAGSSMKQRLMTVAIGGGILLLLIIIVSSLLFSGPSQSPTLLKIAQAQNELIRVSSLGAQKAGSPTAKDLAINTQLSLETDQNDVVAQLKKQGQKTNIKILGATKNSKTDDALSQAEQSNRYDEALTQALQSQLTDYQKLLKTAFDETKSSTLRNLLNNEYQQAGLLVVQSKNS